MGVVLAARQSVNTRLTVQTARGPVAVPAVLCGSLAIHESVHVAGWSISHAPSGLKIVSRLRSKAIAQQIVQYLVTVTDWSRLVMPPDALAVIQVLIRAIPRRLTRQYGKPGGRDPPGAGGPKVQQTSTMNI